MIAGAGFDYKHQQECEDPLEEFTRLYIHDLSSGELYGQANGCWVATQKSPADGC
jgi:hypothetical protein